MIWMHNMHIICIYICTTYVWLKSRRQEFLWSLHALVYYQHDGPREQWLLELAQELEMPAFAPKCGTERQWI